MLLPTDQMDRVQEALAAASRLPTDQMDRVQEALAAASPIGKVRADLDHALQLSISSNAQTAALREDIAKQELTPTTDLLQRVALQQTIGDGIQALLQTSKATLDTIAAGQTANAAREAELTRLTDALVTLTKWVLGVTVVLALLALIGLARDLRFLGN